MIYTLHSKTEWENSSVAPFTELILSWNGKRPVKGSFLFSISVKMEEWSPWFEYALWGSEGQRSFFHFANDIKIVQDTLQILAGREATGFRIHCEGGDELEALHVYTNGSAHEEKPPVQSHACLAIPGISQMALPHPRCADLCSPTAATSVLRYLANCSDLDPLEFAKQVWDGGFDIYGNWVFNCAAAWTHLGPSWHCWVERLDGLQDLSRSLSQKVPVIVSVKGPLKGSATPYANGHLMAVIGLDKENIYCMDPAFPEEQTIKSYPLSEFAQAWKRRSHLAYVFTRIFE